MNKLKTLFKTNVKNSYEDENSKEFPSIDASTPTINYDDIQFTLSSNLDDDHSSNESQEFMINSRMRKSPEQIRQRYNDYHREYLKNYRLRKKNEEAQMKELYQLMAN